MARTSSFASEWAPRLLSVLRVVVGGSLAIHGAQKLLGFPEPAGGGAVALASLLGVAGVLELGGGLLLLLGLFTRPVAFVLSGFMAVAYFMVHAPQAFWPIVNKGELAVIYCFVLLYFAAAGAGEWSVDRLRSAETGPPS